MDPDSRQNQGEINRRTLKCFGVPVSDLLIAKKKAKFVRNEMKWKCTLCDYEEDEYNWLRVFGHIARKHKNEKFNDKEFLKEKQYTGRVSHFDGSILRKGEMV
eukprot:GEMP01109070.1.p2 GENE.GEMP01109070.1~~GEMP01109070.1.p2  ORF type:complete len:103 (+),score=7.97 GEMP01109070.1:97-405(+)